MPRRPNAGWVFADQQAGAGDPVQQRGVASGIEHVDSPGEHRHRHPVGGQCGAMGRTVDAVGTTGDDGHIVFGQAG